MQGKPLLIGCIAGIALLAIPAHGRASQEANASSQQKAPASQQKSASPAKTVKPSWRVRVSSDAPVLLSVRAKNAPLGEIASEIGRQLKVPVTVSPLIAKERITLDFDELPLETALPMLSPQAYLDYLVTNNSPAPKCTAIYLNALDDKGPPPPKVVALAVYFEGNTEDLESAKTDQTESLRVSFKEGKLSVFARKQPLTLLLYEIAQKVGAEVAMEHTSVELVDVEFSDYTVEQALRNISPNIQFYMRVNLQTLETKPLRIVLKEQVKS